MLMLGALNAPDPMSHVEDARAALVKSLDMGDLWQSCADLISRALPCHSCSLLFDIDGYQPRQGRHYLAEAHENGTRLVNSLDVAAPYLDANPRVPWYTFSQIASQDARAMSRLRAQNPTPGWHEFIHLAFWSGSRLEAVLSIRIHAEHAVSDDNLAFLGDLYPILDASLQRVRSLEAERIRHKAFEALLYRLPLATMIVDENLGCLYASQEARRLLSRWTPATWNASAKRLPSTIEQALHPHLKATQTAAGMDGMQPGGSITVRHPDIAGLHLRLEVSASLRLAPYRTHFILSLASLSQGGETDAETIANMAVLPLLHRLSPSERKVALLVAQGLRNDAIAQKLFRSRKTVESQVSSIFRKLNVENRAQLARVLA